MFRDPALDVLWRHQNTLMNLLRCMPEGIWDESDEEGHWVSLESPPTLIALMTASTADPEQTGSSRRLGETSILCPSCQILPLR